MKETIAGIADRRGGPCGRPAAASPRAPTRGAPTHAALRTAPELPNKNPARNSGRAQITSFNFPNNPDRSELSSACRARHHMLAQDGEVRSAVSW
jgi:hypothetical protein